MARMGQFFRAVSANIWEALFKLNCAICGKPCNDGYVCTACDRNLQSHKNHDPLQTIGSLSGDSLLFAWGTYEQTLKQAIARCKYANQPTIAVHLGKSIGEAWQADPRCQGLVRRQGKIPVIPIPMHKQKLQARGFNQAEELAKGFCQITQLPHRPQWLERTKNTKPQMETKSKQERLDNLHQAFRSHIPSGQKGSSVILLDDIYTTGTTIREAMQALEVAEVSTAIVVVLARPDFSGGHGKR